MYLLSTWWRRCVEKRGGGGGREREILSIARGKRVFTPVVDELNLINYIAKRAASDSFVGTKLSLFNRACEGSASRNRGCRTRGVQRNFTILQDNSSFLKDIFKRFRIFSKRSINNFLITSEWKFEWDWFQVLVCFVIYEK